MSRIQYLLLSSAAAALTWLSPQPAFCQPPGMGAAATVEAAKAQKRSLQAGIELVGRVEPPKTTKVGTETEGLVTDIPPEEGEYVKQGQTLAVLENSGLKIQFQEAQVQIKKAELKVQELKSGSRLQEVEKAKGAMLEAKNRWDKEIQDFNRNQELFNKKILSERDFTHSLLDKQIAEQVYLQRKAAYEREEVARPEELAQEEAALEGRKAQGRLLEDKIRKTVIRAPFSGIVTEKLVERGEWVNSGKAVMRLIQIDPLRVEIPAPETVVAQLKPDSEATIRLDALGDKEFKGKVTQVIPEADASTKTFPVRILLPNSDREIKAGMTARVTLSYGQARPAILVPKDAVVIMGSQKTVYIVDRGNVAKAITVTTGQSTNGWIEITSQNITEGALVVTRGNERLRPGQALNVVKQQK